jgi:hypothetical protein
MKEHVATRRYSCCACNNDILPGQSYEGDSGKKKHLKPNCLSAGVVLATEPEPLPGTVRGYDRSLPRMIGSSVRRSNIDRRCNYCTNEIESWIFAGEEYIREVWLLQVGEFWENRRLIYVRIRHSPECPIPFDEPEECNNVIQMPQRGKKTKVRPRSLAA